MRLYTSKFILLSFIGLLIGQNQSPYLDIANELLVRKKLAKKLPDVFDNAKYLLEAIQNISLLKKGKDPDWKNNPFKEMTNQYFAKKDMIEIDSNPNLSATSIQTYNECPLKYKYRFIDKIPGAPEKPYLPLAHVIQLPSSLPPTFVLYLPFGHGVQLAAPV